MNFFRCAHVSTQYVNNLEYHIIRLAITCFNNSFRMILICSGVGGRKQQTSWFQNLAALLGWILGLVSFGFRETLCAQKTYYLMLRQQIALSQLIATQNTKKLHTLAEHEQSSRLDLSISHPILSTDNRSCYSLSYTPVALSHL